MEIIGVCGFGYSGSGAVVDLLKEYSEMDTTCAEKEFVFLYAPDGIDDLSFHITQSCARFQSSDAAILRYEKLVRLLGKVGWDSTTQGNLQRLTKDFLDRITQVNWDGSWYYDELEAHDSISKYTMYRLRRKMNSILMKYFNRNIEIIKPRKMRMSISPKDYEKIVREYLEELVVICGCNPNKKIVLNQVFPANDPERWMSYYQSSKAIIVWRDPRDTYLSLRRVNDNASWFPSNDVRKFIDYYKSMTEKVKELKCSDNILVLRFEDLLYKTEDTVAQIESFIGDCGERELRNKYFDEKKSIQNTQLKKHFSGYVEEIKMIENELKEFLYPFDDSIEIARNKLF